MFVKQLGKEAMEGPRQFGTVTAAKRFLTEDKSGADWSEWPNDLKVREFPN